VNPVRPFDLVMDHSVTTEFAGRPDALRLNMEHEFADNTERYSVAKWAQGAFSNLRVLPPGQGICHQINLEHLSRVIWSEEDAQGELVAFPDSLVGGDSHTPMVNGLSVLGWGVGGIEAASALLGEPIAMALPDVVGCRLVGALREGATATDLVLAVTRRLREHGVVQKFVEFHGPALEGLRLPDRATLANMCPEYGASLGFFPIDRQTLDYLALTGRESHVPLVEAYARAQGLWRDDEAPRVYTEVLEFDLGSVEPSVAGPRLPQQGMPLGRAASSAAEAIRELKGDAPPATVRAGAEVRDGDLAIAAITSCTNTSNPSVMLAAGLLARRARERGLRARPWVKTSLSPGSRVVADNLAEAGLMEALEALGFHVTGYGCMTCGGLSGPLTEAAMRAVEQDGAVLAAVLSSNRNFEGRVHPRVKFAYLASPPLVVAYAIAGSTLVDLTRDPLGHDPDGQPVYLRDVWPSDAEIAQAERAHLHRALFQARYARTTEGGPLWDGIDAPAGAIFPWDDGSSYIRRPPFLGTARSHPELTDIVGAAILGIFGDNLTTDHISPAGYITEDSLAGQYLYGQGVARGTLGSFMQRRVNHDVMLPGAFNSTRIVNEMTPERVGGWTRLWPSGDETSIFEAAARYRESKRPMVVVAGAEYGTGSSRDWAAKGTHLLGVEAVIAESFERIHRSNLVGMGVLPLQFVDGSTRNTLGLNGSETVDVIGLSGGLAPRMRLALRIRRAGGQTVETPVLCRLDTARELAWYRAGGVMPYVLEKFMRQG
ncbi:MAG: aconitate hydratase AcnA, partial [Burkholderiales bacterium]